MAPCRVWPARAALTLPPALARASTCCSARAALLFDCDGVLADTERDGHRVTFNAAFKQKGLNHEWSVEQYGELLKIGGGKERMTKCAPPAQHARDMRLRRGSCAAACALQVLQRPRRPGALQVAARRG